MGVKRLSAQTCLAHGRRHGLRRAATQAIERVADDRVPEMAQMNPDLVRPSGLEAALEATQTGYEVGTRNIVEVLQAQQQLFLTQFNYQQTRHNYVLNMLLLKESAGILNAADVTDLNDHMDPASPVRKAQ